MSSTAATAREGIIMTKKFEELLLTELKTCMEGLGTHNVTLALPTFRALLRIAAADNVAPATKHAIAAECAKAPELLKELAAHVASAVAAELHALATTETLFRAHDHAAGRPWSADAGPHAERYAGRKP